jgi:hypothetical protein
MDSAGRSSVGLPDVAVGLLCVLSVAGVVIGQLVSLIVFDTTGLDRYVPAWVIYAVAPAALVAVAPAVVADRLYDRRRALALAVGVFLAALGASFVTVRLFLIG